MSSCTCAFDNSHTSRHLYALTLCLYPNCNILTFLSLRRKRLTLVSKSKLIILIMKNRIIDGLDVYHMVTKEDLVQTSGYFDGVLTSLNIKEKMSFSCFISIILDALKLSFVCFTQGSFLNFCSSWELHQPKCHNMKSIMSPQIISMLLNNGTCPNWLFYSNIHKI